MSYVFWNIFWCLLFAFGVGGLIGWLLKHFGSGDQVAQAELNWQDKLGNLEEERDRLAAAARASDEKLRTVQASSADAEAWKQKAVECGVVIGDLETRLQLALAEDREDDAEYEQTIAKLRGKLSAAEAEHDVLRMRFSDLETAATTRVADLEGQLRQAVRRIEADDLAFREEIAGLTARLEQSAAAGKELESLRTELADTQQRLAMAEAAGSIEDRIAAERESFQTQLAAIASDRDSFQAQLTGFTERSVTRTAEIERQLEGTASERDALRAANAELQRQLQELNGLLTAARRGQEDATGDEAAHRTRAAELQARIERLVAGDRANDAAYEKRFAELRAELAQSHAETARAAAERHAATEAHEERIAALGAKLEGVEALEAKVADLEAQLKKAAPGDIERIEGIGVAYGQRLRAIGIVWVRDLLSRGATTEGRQEIVAQTGIKAELILTWVNAADLLRVDGITPDWAELLEVSGVDTVKELRNRVPAHLLEKMTETNPFGPGGRFAPALPELEEVESWVGQAKAMTTRVTH